MIFWLALALFALWCVLLLQTTVNLAVFRKLPRAERRPASSVSIVIPARNEERYVGATLDAALAQDHPELEVLIVDDESTDGTADEVAARAGDPRLVPVRARPLQPGWLGKPNALATGAEHARGDWLLFMDADVRLSPHAVGDAVAAAEANGWDHLALLPEFEREGFWEELLMPLIPTVAIVYMPSFLAFVPGVPFAAGGGAFGLVRRSAYDAIGGHETLKSSVVDDIRLAMEIKKGGFVSRACMGLDELRLRMYHGYDEIVNGFTKNSHTGFGRGWLRPVLGIGLTLAVAITPFAWPLIWLAAPAAATSTPGLLLAGSLLLQLAARAAVHRRLRFPLWPVALGPLMTLVSVWIVLRSLRMARGDGVVRWRGREYPYETTEF